MKSSTDLLVLQFVKCNPIERHHLRIKGTELHALKFGSLQEVNAVSVIKFQRKSSISFDVTAFHRKQSYHVVYFTKVSLLMKLCMKLGVRLAMRF